MLKAALLAIRLFDCTAVARSLSGAEALHPGADALRTGAADGFVGKHHVAFPGEVVRC